jgi:hypothetical protein
MPILSAGQDAGFFIQLLPEPLGSKLRDGFCE